MTVPICAVDTETSGIHPDRKPYEIAFIRRDEHGERELSFFVEIDLSDADPFGLRVGRFYDRHPLGRDISGLHRVGGQPLHTRFEASALVAKWTHGAHIIGAVPNFDTHVFDRLLRDHGLIPSHHYHLIDVENLAVGYLAGQGNPIHPPWKSDDLSAALGLEPIAEDERHTALGDARFALRIYDRVMNGSESA
jgi:hypothetical protein